MFQLYICVAADALHMYLHVTSIWFCLFMLLVSKTNKGLQIHKGNAQAQMEMGQESPGRHLRGRRCWCTDVLSTFILKITVKQGNVSYNAEAEQTAKVRERKEKMR